MVEIRGVYEGGFRCRMTHGPSSQELITDAPTDNCGRGEAFSPTDLVATALGSCMLTTMGIVAVRHGIELAGTQVRVTKEMVNTPQRRIGALRVTITFVRGVSDADRQLLEHAAMACPVHHSLHPDIDALVEFVYPKD